MGALALAAGVAAAHEDAVPDRPEHIVKRVLRDTIAKGQRGDLPRLGLINQKLAGRAGAIHAGAQLVAQGRQLDLGELLELEVAGGGATAACRLRIGDAQIIIGDDAIEELVVPPTHEKMRG